mmetsp:Transcript_28534/g.46836  ORF Transcript_28534/g.46836 Transcript_28534/m.46836 type:complete len:95 (+) Transcript_28534:31-315(+)
MTTLTRLTIPSSLKVKGDVVSWPFQNDAVDNSTDSVHSLMVRVDSRQHAQNAHQIDFDGNPTARSNSSISCPYSAIILCNLYELSLSVVIHVSQ